MTSPGSKRSLKKARPLDLWVGHAKVEAVILYGIYAPNTLLDGAHNVIANRLNAFETELEKAVGE